MRRTTAVLALTFIVATGCATLRQVAPYPGAKIRGVDVGGLSLSGLTLTFDVEVDNPYGTDLPVVGLDYVLSTSGKELLEGDLRATETIPAGESRIIPMDVKLPYSIVRDLRDAVRPGESVPYRADLGLKVRAPVIGEIRLPMSADGSLSIPSFP